MKRTLLGIVAIGLLGLPIQVSAQDCAPSLVPSLTQSTNQTCPGGNPYYSTQHTRSWNLKARGGCQDGAWKIFWGSPGDLNMSATGHCGGAAAGAPPQCPGMFSGPWDAGWSADQVHAQSSSTDQVFNGQICVNQTTTTYDTYVTCQNCTTHDTCCNSVAQSDCTLIGEWMGGCRCQLSPVLLDLDGDGFRLTDTAGGVNFDLSRDGNAERIAWTARGSGDAFLALDRNGNGRIDDGGELFGSVTDQPRTEVPNGFNALVPFDSNRNEMIDPQDDEFGALTVWTDANHNGVSEAGELLTLSQAGISGISLNYRETRRIDPFGNVFRYRSRMQATPGVQLGHLVFDVFLRASLTD